MVGKGSAYHVMNSRQKGYHGETDAQTQVEGLGPLDLGKVRRTGPTMLRAALYRRRRCLLSRLAKIYR